MEILLNNDFCDVDSCVLSPLDRGLLLGDGVFTTIKAHGLDLLHFTEHIARLTQHAAKIFMPTNITEQRLYEQCVELIRKNNLQYDTSVVRITLSRGLSSRGIDIPQQQNPTLMVVVTPANNLNLSEVRLCYTSVIRNEYSIITRIKSLNYLEPILARHEAQIKGFDDGIMLNTRGAIAETSTANIFFVTSNYQVLTPHLSEGVLDGIIRNKVIETCKELNLPIFQRSIRPDDVHDCIEAFQTNCLIGIRAISTIDGFKFVYKDDSITSMIRQHAKLSNEIV